MRTNYSKRRYVHSYDLFIDFMDEVVFTWKFWVIAGPIAIIGSYLLNQGAEYLVTGNWYWVPPFLR